MQWIWDLYDSLKERPIVRLVLTMLVLVTAFAVGALVNIGHGFVPIIDKVDLIILISFYVTVLSLAISAIRASTVYFCGAYKPFVQMLQALISTTRTVERGAEKNEVTRELTKRGRISITLLISVTAIILTVIISFNTFDLWIFEILSGIIVAIATILIITLISTGFVLVGRDSLTTALFKKNPEVKFIASMLILALLGFSISAGHLYMEVLRRSPPSLIIRTEGNPCARKGTIALPASEGFILFYEGDPTTHYVPLNKIEEISGLSFE